MHKNDRDHIWIGINVYNFWNTAFSLVMSLISMALMALLNVATSKKLSTVWSEILCRKYYRNLILEFQNWVKITYNDPVTSLKINVWISSSIKCIEEYEKNVLCRPYYLYYVENQVYGSPVEWDMLNTHILWWPFWNSRWLSELN